MKKLSRLEFSFEGLGWRHWRRSRLVPLSLSQPLGNQLVPLLVKTESFLGMKSSSPFCLDDYVLNLLTSRKVASESARADVNLEERAEAANPFFAAQHQKGDLL